MYINNVDESREKMYYVKQQYLGLNETSIVTEPVKIGMKRPVALGVSKRRMLCNSLIRIFILNACILQLFTSRKFVLCSPIEDI